MEADPVEVEFCMDFWPLHNYFLNLLTISDSDSILTQFLQKSLTFNILNFIKPHQSSNESVSDIMLYLNISDGKGVQEIH